MAPPKGGRGHGGRRGGYGRNDQLAPDPIVQLTEAQQEQVQQALALDNTSKRNVENSSSTTCSSRSTLAPPQVSATPALGSNLLEQSAAQCSKSEALRQVFERQQHTLAYQKMQPGRQSLPALAVREELMHTVALNDVTVVAGGTGCGKNQTTIANSL